MLQISDVVFKRSISQNTKLGDHGLNDKTDFTISFPMIDQMLIYSVFKQYYNKAILHHKELNLQVNGYNLGCMAPSFAPLGSDAVVPFLSREPRIMFEDDLTVELILGLRSIDTVQSFRAKK